MKKYLIILLCSLGLGGCGYFVEQLNEYVSTQRYEGYFLPAKPQLYTDLNDKFDNECHDVSEYIVASAQNQDLKQYLTDRGADCETTENVCYFYFKRNFKNDNIHDSSVYIEVSSFDLINKIYRDVSGLTLEVPFINKESKNAIKIDFIRYSGLKCHNLLNMEVNRSEENLKQRVKEIINASE